VVNVGREGLTQADRFGGSLNLPRNLLESFENRRRLRPPLNKRPTGRPSLLEEMLQADFCGSPPGWNGGDSDRYLPAILLGCIPVFFSKREFRPFEEILDWDQFSLRVSKHEIPKLHEIIGNISSAKVVKMRRAMAQAWEVPCVFTFHCTILVACPRVYNCCCCYHHYCCNYSYSFNVRNT